MKTITIIMGGYLPGYKYGGPVRSVINLTERLGNEYSFKIVTRDRDLGDTSAYSNIRIDEWNKVGLADVFYVKPKGFTEKLIKEITEISDMIYIWGCYDDYARAVLRLKKKNKLSCQVIIASMGLFSPGAYQIKHLKKVIYMSYLKLFGYLKQIAWSATSELECEDIRRVVGKDAFCHIAQDLPRQFKPGLHNITKSPGELKIIFLSRISRKKNLKYVLEILSNLDYNIQLDIYGNMEDKKYWEECLELLQGLPESIHWNYCGEADSEQVLAIFSKYHLFFFPTLGENFGHVIHEAMAAGCVPLISDQTPWSEMNTDGVIEIGSLSRAEYFESIIKKYYFMNELDFHEKSSLAQKYALEMSLQEDLADGYRKIFH